ncbi:2Fe-2S iron-sulfur cluster binding domain-containing protein [bacterium]|nr:MAG: 2Fe-2S iron-sulfur cluster binding domain-containing protein [bacterium]
MPERNHETEDGDGGLGPSSRRGFLKGVGAAGLAATLSPLAAAETAFRENSDAEPDPHFDAPIQKQTARVATGAAALVEIGLKVNGKSHRVRIDPRASLLDTLRESLHLTGTKKGCDHGQCGACTVHINGKRANSCLSLALTNQGDEITTIEGLGTPEKLHPMQTAFVEHDGFQCGYCTSGQIMSAVALTKEPCGPADADVKELMSGNICRCGAYSNIVDAIQQVRKETK